MPSFYLALLLMLFLSVELEVLPIAGLHSVEAKEGFAYYTDMAWHLILPIGVMVFVSLGSMIVYIRSLTLEILKSDYYYFARSRGLSDTLLLRRYILRNPAFLSECIKSGLPGHYGNLDHYRIFDAARKYAGGYAVVEVESVC
jgi:ABC-type dipeptide/oligopeptide/nickel transport system permease component